MKDRSEKDPSELPAAQRIVEVARQSLKRGGLMSMTVDELAREAGISRSTFYRNFPSTEAVMLKIIVEEGHSLMLQAAAAAAACSSFVEQMKTLIVYPVLHVSDNEWVRRLSQPDTTMLSVNYVLEGEPDALSIIGDAFLPLLQDGMTAGRLREGLTTSAISEWLLRNIWSLQIVPGPHLRTAESLRQYAADFILPGILRSEHPPASAAVDLEPVMEALRRIERKLP